MTKGKDCSGLAGVLKTDGDPELPVCFDRIEVLWEMDDTKIEWWPAEVVALTSVFSGVLLAVGSIVYDKRGEYNSQFSDVEFIHGNLIRPKRVSRCAKDEPENSWRSVQDHGRCSDNEEWTTDAIADVHNKGDSKRQDDNAIISPSICKSRRQRSGMIPRNLNVVSHAGKKGPSQREGAAVQRPISPPQLFALEDGLSTCMKRLAKLERAIEVRFQPNTHTTEPQTNDTLKLYARRAVLRLLQKPIRRANTGTGIIDGGHTSGFISASIDCTLQQFAALASEISTASCDTAFLPSFAATQTNSSATTELHILLPSLKVLCTCLDVREYADREFMLIRYGPVTGKDVMLRVLGTMKEEKRNGRVIYMIGNSSPHVATASRTKWSLNVLERPSAEWDAQNDKFVHGLEAVHREVACAYASGEDPDLQISAPASFHLKWRKSASLAQRVWTKDVHRDGDILLGSMHIVLPALYFYTSTVCSQLDKAVSPEYCQNILQ